MFHLPLCGWDGFDEDTAMSASFAVIGFSPRKTVGASIVLVQSFCLHVVLVGELFALGVNGGLSLYLPCDTLVTCPRYDPPSRPNVSWAWLQLATRPSTDKSFQWWMDGWMDVREVITCSHFNTFLNCVWLLLCLMFHRWLTWELWRLLQEYFL